VPESAAGLVATRASLRTAAGRVLSRVDLRGIEREMGAPAVAIHRATLQELLVSTLGCEPLHLDRQVVGYEARQDSVAVRFADGGRVEGALLIGADGIRSAVRAQLLGDGEPLHAGYLAWRGVAEPARAPEEASESWGRGRRFGIVPIENGKVYWFATLNAPAGGRDEPGTVRCKLEDPFAGWHPPIAELLAATPESAILRNDLLHRPPVERWGEGRVTLLGDAAHPMTPDLGQGACQAIEDAVALADCLHGASNAPDLVAALRRYEARRIPRANGFVRAALRTGRIGQSENAIACWLRNALVSLVPSSVSRRQLVRSLR
jgi:2-polyprenyl-6-methoxyphenol hydroxylase-like FAD-dependent oxidoreductase